MAKEGAGNADDVLSPELRDSLGLADGEDGALPGRRAKGKKGKKGKAKPAPPMSRAEKRISKSKQRKLAKLQVRRWHARAQYCAAGCSGG